MSVVDPPRGRADRSEEEQERLNRQMAELLQELRVAMPGVQVLFGFLLAVPFQQRFGQATDFQHAIYTVALVAAALATALLIAPSAHHRIMFEHGDKPNIIRLGTTQMLAGLGALALAMNAAVLLVSDFLFKTGTAVVIVVCLVAVYATLWFGLGVSRRVRS